jgi:hypothetical protein
MRTIAFVVPIICMSLVGMPAQAQQGYCACPDGKVVGVRDVATACKNGIVTTQGGVRGRLCSSSGQSSGTNDTYKSIKKH